MNHLEKIRIVSAKMDRMAKARNIAGFARLHSEWAAAMAAGIDALHARVAELEKRIEVESRPSYSPHWFHGPVIDGPRAAGAAAKDARIAELEAELQKLRAGHAPDSYPEGLAKTLNSAPASVDWIERQHLARFGRN
jgi:hypothetical protein